MINASTANTLVRQHSVEGSVIEDIVPGGDIWPADESTIIPWLQSHPDVTIDEWDDGSSHDRSIIRRYTFTTPQGKVIVWSYNNNAWGFADAYIAREAPTDVSDFAQRYVDNVGRDEAEAWLLEMAGYDEETEDDDPEDEADNA